MKKKDSAQLNYLAAIRRRVFYFINDRNIKKEKNVFLQFLTLSGLPPKPNNISVKNWLIELYKNGPLKTFPFESKKVKNYRKKNQKKEYRSYLETEKWRKKREEAFEFHGRLCNHCQTKKNLQVHHLTYVNIYNEKMEDLMILCKSCHKKVHNKK